MKIKKIPTVSDRNKFPTVRNFYIVLKSCASILTCWSKILTPQTLHDFEDEIVIQNTNCSIKEENIRLWAIPDL